MDGKKYFQERCTALGVDWTNLVKLGKTGKHFQGSLSHRFDSATRKSSNRYVICYFETLELYVAWKLNTEKASSQSVFSVVKAVADEVMPGSVCPFSKNKEYAGRGAEMVYAFRPDAVDLFIQEYLAEK